MPVRSNEKARLVDRMGWDRNVRKESEIPCIHPTFANSLPTIFLAWWINSLEKQEPGVIV